MSSDWSDTMVWFGQILLYFNYYHPIYMILGLGRRVSWLWSNICHQIRHGHTNEDLESNVKCFRIVFKHLGIDPWIFISMWRAWNQKIVSRVYNWSLLMNSTGLNIPIKCHDLKILLRSRIFQPTHFLNNIPISN